jgi:gamma-glutamylputrescine oxidase
MTMPAPASSRPWYETTCREPPLGLPALAGRHETEVCVIGGGLAGLATALSLAERGGRVMLVEAGELGQGASGRSGGLVAAGFTRSSLDLERELGTAHARALHQASAMAVELARRRIRRWGIACDPVEGILMASFFDHPQGLRRDLEALNGRFGARLEWRDRGWMRSTYRTACYTEGLFDPDGFHLDPLALTRGYARAASACGAALFENSPALGFERGGAGWRVRLAHGAIEARHLVLCTSVYGDPLIGRLRRALLPVASYAFVSEPLGQRLNEAIGQPWAVYDDRFATGYYRPLRDGRLLWGGRISLRERPPDLAGLMRRDLARIYPQLADLRMAALWSGRMGFARHKMPIMGQLRPGLWLNTAYGGHGLNGTSLGGELVARAILEQDPTIEAFERFRPVPVFGPLGRLAAQAIAWGHAIRDQLRARRRARPGPAASGSEPRR